MQTRQRERADTAGRILDVAERLVQRRGFNGFSYADVASELKVTTASLHYHFRGKAELGAALVDRYASRFGEALEAIDQRGGDAPGKLRAYARIYADVLERRRMCLCGMLAAEYETLPKRMRDAVVRFFDRNEAWLAGVLEQGAGEGSLRLGDSPTESAQVARAIVSGLEGAMLTARPYGDVGRFEVAAEKLLASLAGDPPGKAARSRRR